MPSQAISQTPEPLNITVRQNQEWALDFYYKDSTGADINLSGYTPLLQLRTSALAKTAALSLSSGSGLTFNATTSPQVRVNTGMTVAPGKYEWDLKLTPSNGEAIYLSRGIIQVDAEVSRV
jgi:hypothetical protein